jgi:poly(3-hydroxybutyrate) depolymerase
LLHFQARIADGPRARTQGSHRRASVGHYATLLRGTVEAMLPAHEVYITDWIDARMVPRSRPAKFDLTSTSIYVIGMLDHLGPGAHVVAVCQPSVPVLAAVSLMEEDGIHSRRRPMTLMGGPIDTRRAPTAVNHYAQEKGTDWFRRNVIMAVPFPHPGFMRPVYPGFLQLSGFMGMNLDRHVTAHRGILRAPGARRRRAGREASRVL